VAPFKNGQQSSGQFDGAAGAGELERLVNGLLASAARGNTDGVLAAAQQIFTAVPRGGGGGD
jgi:hypothetical protein